MALFAHIPLRGGSRAFALHSQKGDACKVFLVVIDYASIVLFFVLLAALLLVVARQKPTATGEETTSETAVESIPLANKVTYGLFLLLFVLLFAATWLSERKISHAHSSK
ncbi:MAG TPA: hypothetical protein VIZ18_18045 [Ktedonobacteraceae bacterium]